MSSGNAGVGKASSDISMASLIGANEMYAEDVVLSEFRFRVRNTVHISTRNIYGISCARSYRTLRDGSFEDAFPRHFVPGYDRCVPPGQACRRFATASSWKQFRNTLRRGKNIPNCP
jgi:hypothetical protein